MMGEMPRDAVPVNILVVDDEPPLLRLVVRVLERQGYSVLTASDGDQAIELFDKYVDSIDVVLLDIVIPPNGIAGVMEHMVSARDDLVVVLTSGDIPEPALTAKIKECGGVFLRKPFLPKSLLAALKAGLDS